jgi:ATP-dependent exoDNAse (exonuclease V) beta subunit
MPQPRSEPERQSPRVSLHIGASPEAAWEDVVRRWFEKIAAHDLQNQPAAVVTASRSQAYFFRRRLLGGGKSLLGVKFFSASQLRDTLLRGGNLHVPLREHLRLLLAVIAETFAGKTSYDEAALVAQSIARDPDRFLRAIDQLRGAGWSLDEIDSPALREIAAQFEQQVRECGFTFVHDADRATLTRHRPVFGDLLLFGFDAAHWPLWPLLRAATFSAENATVVLSDPRDEARDMDETWVGTWEQSFGAAEVISTSSVTPTASFAETLLVSASDVHFVIGRDTTQQARAIVALAAKFLANQHCERLGILFSGPGALPRLVATFLESAMIAHNDGIAHLAPSAFDDPAWRAWLELQQTPRIKPLLRFARANEEQILDGLPASQFEDTLRRAYKNLLIDDVALLRDYCANSFDLRHGNAAARVLEKIQFLPESGTLTEFLSQTHAIFSKLHWRERWDELERLSRKWSNRLTLNFSKYSYLRWLQELLGAPSVQRDDLGGHPYARVHLLRYADAHGQTWSHLIFAGLNDEVWPAFDEEPAFLRDEDIDKENCKNKILNRRASKRGRQGEGHWSVLEGKTLLLGRNEQRQIRRRQLLSLVESVSSGIGASASLYSETTPSRIANPSEFFSSLYFDVHRRGVSQQTLHRIEGQTRAWLKDWSPVDAQKVDSIKVGRTRYAFDARRQLRPAGEYEFALRTPADQEKSLRVTQWEQALRWPAIVWMKIFLGVEANDDDGDSWAVATGQWVHRWLAESVGSVGERNFVDVSCADEIRRRILEQAREFRKSVAALCANRGKLVPDWWRSGWSNALYIADSLAAKVCDLHDWSEMAVEWSLGNPALIALSDTETLRIRGRIDLILARGKSQQSQIGYDDLWVVDYKTGRQRGFKLLWGNDPPKRKFHKQLIEGRGVQLALYALAVHALGVDDVQLTLLSPAEQLEPQFQLADVFAGNRRIRDARAGSRRIRIRCEIPARDAANRYRSAQREMGAHASAIRGTGVRQMTGAADEAARERFVRELDRNFSVIASAGSGKTRAITDRVADIAKDRQRALEWLPQLVVVTYTNRAADEMQQRTRQLILETDLPLETVDAFGRAFFGTIHAFCMKLLAAHGHRLGLPARLETITDDDDDLWNEFVQQHTEIGRSLGEENRRLLLRLMQARQLMELARKPKHDFTAPQSLGRCPECDFSKVEAAVETGQATNIPKAKAQLREWLRRWRETEEFAPWPSCATTAKDFIPRWREAFRPLREWASACASCVAAEVQCDYRAFRLARGAITYSDQIALAAELLRLPEIAKRIRSNNYRVMLDEAQDTDPQQFFVLLEITRPVAAGGEWMETRRDGPRAGHFCMVGDFQQSIYRDPTDLNHYRNLHSALVETGAAEQLKFSVTFRLDQAQLDFVNDTFAKILNNAEGQVDFVELSPRPEILPGQVIRFELGDDVDLSLTETRRAQVEAEHLAKWIQEAGLKKLRAGCWREVAILCPRKAWLRSIRDALAAQQIPVEVQSQIDRQAEHPAHAWLTALLAIMVDPNASYEIVGVLREVFGISDDELARFANGNGYKFQIERKTSVRGVVADTLNVLMRLRETLPHQPLLNALREIVRMTQLRERLRSLPQEDFGDSANELDKLLTSAASAELQQQSLAEFALVLRRNFDKIRETEPAEDDAVQLITAHKAKGSEWDAVIVPFLAREARLGGNIRYPLVIPGEQPFIAFDRSDRADLEDEMKKVQRQEMERLLYVALTRARHTLVLALDTALFRGKRGVHTDTQLKWLQADAKESNAKVISRLAGEATACEQTAARHKQGASEPVPDSLSALRLETGWVDIARQRAASIIHTIIPSQLAPKEELEGKRPTEEWIEIEPELRPPRISNPATRYGLWWHDFAEQIDWRAEPNRWSETFEQKLAMSPAVGRSKREWQLLQRHIESVDGLGRDLRKAKLIRPEMPFFWRVKPNVCLEGIIDLALFEDDESKWFILDWKTNRIDRNQTDKLRISYRPQIAAYWRAIAEMTGQPVGAAIYSSSTGQLLVYDENELTAEWNRLRDLTANDLAAHISDSASTRNRA